jgi:hypothetical protein
LLPNLFVALSRIGTAARRVFARRNII